MDEEDLGKHYNDPEWLQADLMDARGQLMLLEMKLDEIVRAIRIQKLYITNIEKRLKDLK